MKSSHAPEPESVCLRKILILSYWSYPNEIVGAVRAESWLRNFSDHGVFPVMVTRDWTREQLPFVSGGEVAVEVDRREGAEVHRVRCRQPPRELFPDALALPGAAVLRKAWNAACFVGSFLSAHLAGMHELYRVAARLLRADAEIELILASVSPFHLLGLAQRLSREFELPWIADYRDEWSGNPRLEVLDTPQKVLERGMAELFERPWTRDASLVTTTSAPKARALQRRLSRPSEVILNGYEAARFAAPIAPFEVFTIAYVGTVYPQQELAPFLEGLDLFLEGRPDAEVRLRLVGVDDASIARIRRLLRRDDVLDARGWVSRAEALELMRRAHVLYYTGWRGHQGVIAVKVLEYIACEGVIFLCPSDEDVLADLVARANAGYVLDEAEEVARRLTELYARFERGERVAMARDEAFVETLSREHQDGLMCELIEATLSNPERP